MAGKMREEIGLPHIQLGSFSICDSDITEAPLERSVLRSSIPPAMANARPTTLKKGNHEHIEIIDEDIKFFNAQAQARRSSFQSSSTVDTFDIMKISRSTKHTPTPITISTATVNAEVSSSPPKKWYHELSRTTCALLTLVPLVIIPIICICIVIGIFVPDAARTDHGKAEKVSTAMGMPSSASGTHSALTTPTTATATATTSTTFLTTTATSEETGTPASTVDGAPNPAKATGDAQVPAPGSVNMLPGVASAFTVGLPTTMVKKPIQTGRPWWAWDAPIRD